MWKTYSGEILFRVGGHVFAPKRRRVWKQVKRTFYTMKRGLNAIRFWGKAVLIWVNAFLSKPVPFWVKYLPKNNCCTSFSVLSFMTKILGENVLVTSVSRMRHWRPSRALVRHAFQQRPRFLCLRPSVVFIKENSLLAVKPPFLCMRFTHST